MGLTNIFVASLLAASAVVASPTKRNIGQGNGGKDKVVAYWGNTGLASGNMDILDLCKNEAIDKVIISFLNVFPEQNTRHPGNGELNLGSSCGWVPGPNEAPAPDHSDTGLLYCPTVKTGLDLCKANKKEVLLSLGGASPKDQQFTTEKAARDFAKWLWLHFGAGYPAGTDRPFLDFVIDGIDLDIEAGLPAAQGQKYFPEFINEIRAVSSNTWKIGAAPQCVNPDGNMGTYIQSALIDYVFVQLYNTDKCSAKNQVDKPGDSTNTFATWLSQSYASSNIEVYAGLVSFSGNSFPSLHLLTCMIASKLLCIHWC
jgi:chitinase